MSTIASEVSEREVIAGVDTHKDTHTAAVIDSLGRVLGDATFPATAAGYRALTAWLGEHGRLVKVGVEGTGSYGAGLAEHLQGLGVVVVEVDRPNRKVRRSQGKSDPIDALAAARAALGEVATGAPKERGGPVDALRSLRVARRDAVEARGDTMRRIKTLLVTAPEPLRARLRGLKDPALIRTCAALRPAVGDPADLAVADPLVAAKVALQRMAARYRDLTREIRELDALLAPLVAALAPDLLTHFGVGIDTAAQLIVTVGDNPTRMRSEASFAALTGTSPIPASSGRTTGRHRLNRGGDRQANAALYRVTMTRLRWDDQTRAYSDKRGKQRRTKIDTIRCLKRYIARELYPDLLTIATG